MRGELPDLVCCAGVVVPQPDHIAIGEREYPRRVQGVDVEPVPSQLQVIDHLLLEDVADVRACRDVKAWEPLLGDRGAANYVPPLKHLHVQSRTRQVSCGDETVVSRTDDDNLLPVDHESPPSTGPVT